MPESQLYDIVLILYVFMSSLVMLVTIETMYHNHYRMHKWLRPLHGLHMRQIKNTETDTEGSDN